MTLPGAEEPTDTHSSGTPEDEQVKKSKRSESINVVVVDDEESVRNIITRNLRALGVENVSSYEAAEDAYFDMKKRAMEGERKRVHLLISDVMLRGQNDGSDLIELIKKETKNPPFMVAMSGFIGSIAPEIKESLDEHANIIYEKNPDFYDKLPEIIDQAKSFIMRQALEETRREQPVHQSLFPPPVKPKAPTETPEEFNLVKNIRDKFVAVLDVDGTLFKSYFTEYFLKFLMDEEDFMKLIEGDEAKKEILTELLDMFQKARESKEEAPDRNPYYQFGGYESFIEKTEQLWAQFMKGL